MKTINFNGFNCTIETSAYQDNNRIALILNDAVNGEQVAVASVNVPEFHVPNGMVLIKNWSENDGMLKTLTDAGIVREMNLTVPCGYSMAHLCEYIT